MSFYLLPNINNEIRFPSISSNSNERNYTIKGNEISNCESEKNKNNINDSRDFSSDENLNVNKFYEFKHFGEKFGSTRTREKLNRFKVHILVKPVSINGKQVNVAIPINNYEDLGNTGYSRALTALASTFLMRTAQDLAGIGLSEGSPGSRPFILEHAIAVETPYETEEKVSLKNLSEGLYDKVRIKEENIQAPDQSLEILKSMETEDRLKTSWDGQVLRSEINREEDAMLDLDVQILEAAFGFLYYYSSPYEYDYSFLDNTIFTNSRPYQAQPRDEENFNRNFKDFFKNIKNFNFEEQKDDLKVLFTESERILFRNTTELLSKNIIPVFCDLEEAQNLLITVLEELTQPYRAIRPIETAQSTQKVLTNISESLDYIDDSLSLDNYYFSENEHNLLQKSKDLLRKYRIIKSPNLSFSSDDYGSENYQLHGTKMRKSVYESWQLFFDEAEDLGKEYDYQKGPWDDTRCHLPKSDKKLLAIAGDLKIISMGLGDFLDFWNNQKIKNGEVLFVPSLKEISQKRSTLTRKKPIDRLYEYQKRFRGNSNDEVDNFDYEIKISSI